MINVMIRQYGMAMMIAGSLLFGASTATALNLNGQVILHEDPASQALVEEMGQALDMTSAQQKLLQLYLQSQMAETRSYLEQLLTDEQLTELNRLKQQSEEKTVTKTSTKPATLVI